MNYEATMYTNIVSRRGKYVTTSETFRERLNELVDERSKAAKAE